LAWSWIIKRGTGGTPAVVRPRVGLVGGVEVPSRHALSGL
jgi:hypothetical protein